MASLVTILRINSLSCVLFGLAFSLAPDAVARFLGKVSESVILALGIVLLANGAHLLWASLRPVGRREVYWFSAGDLLWWLVSMMLLAFPIWIDRPAGQAATAGVASCVALMGLSQLWQQSLKDYTREATAFRARLLRSWLALSPRIKVWLFVLNLVFMLAFFVPGFARPVLLSYIASGPLLIALVFVQGGLTRATGVGHLLAWGPLAVWLACAEPSAQDGASTLLFGTTLMVVLAICLGFDLYDLVRWISGDRGVIGLSATAPDHSPPTNPAAFRA